MTTTGRAIRRAMLRNTHGVLGRMGLTTAVAGSSSLIRDATRYDMNTRATSDDAECYARLGVRFTGTATAVGATTLTDTTLSQFGTDGLTGAIVRMGSSYATITSHTATVLTFTGGWTGGTPSLGTYYVDYAHVAKVQYIDPADGDIEIDPVTTDEVIADTPYELWRIWPDDVDVARDKALTTRCSQWRVKPLSIVKEIADWSTAAYAAATGGVFNASAAPANLSFPFRFPSRSMLVTNSGTDGLLSSEAIYVQPGQTYRVFGWVSVRSGTASVQVLLDGATYATLVAADTQFTLRGWQTFDFTFTVPTTSAGRIGLEVGGAASTCIAEWAGVGILPTHETMLSHESRVISEHDLGHYYAFSLPASVTGSISWHKINGVNRRPAGDGVVAVFDSPPGSSPVYYAERHRYSALQSDYMTKADRTEGDVTETDCNEDYACWATIVELLEPQAATLSGALAGVLRDALKNLHSWERRVGADPLVIAESSVQGSIPILTL